MHPFEQFLISQGFIRYNPKTNKEDQSDFFSTYGPTHYVFKNGDVEIRWGLREYGYQPFLISPIPRIRHNYCGFFGESSPVETPILHALFAQHDHQTILEHVINQDQYLSVNIDPNAQKRIQLRKPGGLRVQPNG